MSFLLWYRIIDKSDSFFFDDDAINACGTPAAKDENGFELQSIYETIEKDDNHTETDISQDVDTYPPPFSQTNAGI